MNLKPIYTVDAFLDEFSMSRTRFYELVKAGLIKTRKNGSRTVITAKDAQAWLDSLPMRVTA